MILPSSVEHCFGGDETQETTIRRKTLRWILCTFKERRRKYMKGKLSPKQQLLRDKFADKRYRKGILAQIKEESYKIITSKVFTEDEENSSEKKHKKLNTQWGTVYSIRPGRVHETGNNGTVL